MYALDKSAAKKQRWRIPELRLHILAVCGGWPGAYIAQRQLRHKSVKRQFKVVFWLTVFINIASFAWLLSKQGQGALSLITNFINQINDIFRPVIKALFWGG
ncbi:hypothetical protein C2869_07770 [Saccharobesus litoralis]|uniref:DUF1294 domain-containing protein n=1 Tax=Saccharobesus litoralis TaxID=2172099 RepID=A0A2S0VQ43_9ALTE|nr:DUF1294 domain-containing protein [Saccharobesus litoralis]AWB66335.1 hypothetical protein C2869_07770 [Saccharobesus litoralis]